MVRLQLVEEHIACENRHDLAAIMQTVGAGAEYDDVPWLEHYSGRAGVERYYSTLLASVPDLYIDLQRAHATADTVVVEVVIRGTHLRSRHRAAPARRLSRAGNAPREGRDCAHPSVDDGASARSEPTKISYLTTSRPKCEALPYGVMPQRFMTAIERWFSGNATATIRCSPHVVKP